MVVSKWSNGCHCSPLPCNCWYRKLHTNLNAVAKSNPAPVARPLQPQHLLLSSMTMLRQQLAATAAQRLGIVETSNNAVNRARI
ncbi:uncharacterized protein LOC121403970 isoform X2 [Drosophila obscura]|uniref:uncharacterized protein LOC121403970 isoform X2 n=1 Tax=Drosophila obscura TaxID=7282 RepID=UPI001BB120E3|nr:uncharacterized protein LOC121403970 isoform X2 [Drosophila obscura]